MGIKRLTLNDPKWDEFCLESDDCWFYHTSEWIEYTLEYGGKDSELLSFFIEDGNKDILAICPLIRNKNKLIFSGNNGPNPALRNELSTKISKELIKKIFVEIDSIADKYEINECLMSLTPLTKNNLSNYTFNYLMRYGFENVSLNTQIIDLERDEKTLWGDIKKSHRNEIKKGEELFKFTIVSQHCNDLALFKEFKNLHKLAAGRQTRSDLSWDLQYEWITKGYGLLVIANLDDVPIGGAYSLLYKNAAYYGISANHPDYDEKLPISHSILWEMIKWLKQNRYDFFETGIQYYSNQPYDTPSEKDLQISLFKRHFGGFTITFHRGKKEYKK